MGELQAAAQSFPFWKALSWCFYLITVLIVIELLSSDFDDDDDQGGGTMIPVYQGLKK